MTWEDAEALTVPSSALFRSGGGWAVFAVDGKRARLTPVEVARNNGELAAITGGLEAGATVILYPGPGISDGTRITRR